MYNSSHTDFFSTDPLTSNNPIGEKHEMNYPKIGRK